MELFQSLDRAWRSAQRLGWRPLLVAALLLVGSARLAVETRRAELHWQESGGRESGAEVMAGADPAPTVVSRSGPKQAAGRGGAETKQRPTAAVLAAAPETSGKRESPVGGGTVDGRLDLNRATSRELEGLPGIGPTIAGRIVAYRQSNGPFRSPEELRRVPGVGPARLAGLKGLIDVTSAEGPAR